MDWKLLQLSGLMLATTVGAGIFALPYVASASGLLVFLAYLLALTFVVRYSHSLYLRMLDAEDGNLRLVGLVSKHLSPRLREAALLIVGGGLMLTLVAYLILGGEFLYELFPGLGFLALPVFWLISAAPVLMRLPRIFAIEFGAGLVIILLVLGVFGFGFPFENLDAHLFGPQWFLPFGIVLFSLAGWPAVEPIFEERRLSGVSRGDAVRAMNRGTNLSALLYALFILGILGASLAVPADASVPSGLWPVWFQGAFIVFGLFAIWTSYPPVSLTLVNSFTHDLGWSRSFSVLLVIFLPLVLVLLGLRDFLGAASLAGGIFLAAEYLFLLLTARKALLLSVREGILIRALILVFLAAAVYELWYFVVQ